MVNHQRVSEICDQFADAIRRGERVTAEAYLERYREHAEELRPALLAVQAMLKLSPSRELPAAGDTVGEFRIVRIIAQGGMGVVYEAEQSSSTRRVALKVLSRTHFMGHQEERWLIRFENEVLASRSLDHPRIVPIVANGRCRDFHYFAMALIDGFDWREWNRRLHEEFRQEQAEVGTGRSQVSTLKAERWKEIVVAVRDVAEALQHAHERGVIHRDIKPSNLLRDSQGQSWVVDFGLASLPNATTVTATGELVGTLRYMSPEQVAEGSNRADERTDIYSLGATLYELLTGQPVVTAEHPTDQLRAIVEGSPIPPRQLEPSLPVSLETIVLKMIAFLPQDRYASAFDLVNDLNRWLQGLPIEARRVSWQQRVTRWSRARMGMVLSATAGLLVLVVGLGLLVGRLRSTEGELRLQLATSHMAEAQAYLTSREPGQRFRALQSVHEAVATQANRSAMQRFLPKMVQTVATALSLCDARQQTLLARDQGGSLDASVFSRDLQLGTRHVDGHLEVVRVKTQEVLARLPLESLPNTVCFSADGARIGLLREPESAASLDVWDWAAGRRLWTRSANEWGARPQRFALDLSADDSLLAVGLDDGRVVLVDETTGDLRAEWKLFASSIAQVRFSQNGRWLAASSIAARAVQVWDVQTGTKLVQWTLPEDTFALSWSSNDERLAVGAGYDIHIFETSGWPMVAEQILTGPREVIANLFFHPSGRWLAVYGYEGKTRIWDRSTQTVTLELQGHAHYFAPSGNQLAFRTYDGLGVWELALDDIVWHQHARSTGDSGLECLSFVGDGTRLMLAGSRGAELWDIPSRQRLLSLTGMDATDLWALEEGREILLACDRGLFRLDVRSLASHESDDNGSLDYPWERLNSKRVKLPEGERPWRVSGSSDGATIGVATESGGIGMLQGETRWQWLVPPGSHYRRVVVSGDGQFLVASQQNDRATTVWQVSGRLRRVPIESAEGGEVAFWQRGGSTYLVASEPGQYRGWQLGLDRDPVNVWNVLRPSGYQKSAVATNGSELLALAYDSTTVQMVSTLSGLEVARLIDGYQKYQTSCIALDAPTDQLATVGPEGFAVWNLRKVSQHLNRLGLPTIKRMGAGSRK